MNAMRYCFLLIGVIGAFAAAYADSPLNRFGEMEGRLLDYFRGGAHSEGPVEPLPFDESMRRMKRRDASFVSVDRDEAFRKAFESFRVSIRRADGRISYQIGEVKPVDGSVRTIIVTFLVKGDVVQQVLVVRSID